MVASSLTPSLSAAEIRGEPLSLRAAANRDFRSGGPAGWIGGSGLDDLSALPPGPLVAAEVPFEIIAPASNSGRGAVVLGKHDQNYLPKRAEVALASSGRANNISGLRSLYLLHAAAWIPDSARPIGQVVAHYSDGTTRSHDVVNGRDVGNWMMPASGPNAAVGWKHATPSGTVGLHVSRFELDPGRQLASVSFEGTGLATWMILAATVSPEDRPIADTRVPLVVAADADWAPYAHSVEIAPGGVFDFSGQLDAPAGKHGALRVTSEGHFEFEKRPGQRVRFWGVNLCFTANFLEKAEADRLAERLARSGYNSVRFHHFDQLLVRPGGASYELDPARLDQLDYLFAAMKRRGIYINIDLFSIRGFNDAELKAFGFEPGTGTGRTRDPYKGLIPISEPARDSWERFARNLLTRKNPYTGLTWAEDPALIGICPVNEDALVTRLGDPMVRARYEEAFAASRRAPVGETAAQRSAAWSKFIYDTHIRSDARLFAFLRSLGVKALISGSNFGTTQGLTYVREHYDYVDNHLYYDHPKFPVRAWQPPFAFHQGSSTRQFAQTPRALMPTRVLGRPFAVTEFNFCRPNQHRAEGAVLMPAYASLQDWDALYNFQYAMSREMVLESGVENYFALANDPIGIIADRVGALLFLRSDIAPATGAIAYAVRPAEAYGNIWNRFPESFSRIGLVTRIGSLPGEPAEVLAANPDLSAAVTGTSFRGDLSGKTFLADDALAVRLQEANALPVGSIDAAAQHYVSDTRQIELHAEQGALKVVAPRAELFVLPAGAAFVGDRAAVQNGDTFGTVSVVALDGEPLASTRRILVTHLTDALPTGARFADQDRRLLEAWGRAPHLVHRGEVALTLRLAAGPWRAWAVDATGARGRELTLTRDGDAVALALATHGPDGTRLAYELAR